MDLGIEGHIAVVTGGGRGLGGGMVDALAAEGARVVVWDRDDTAHERAATLTEKGYEAIAVVADVTDSAAVNAAVAGVVDRWGGVQIAVSCAGFSRDSPVAEMSDEDWHAVVDVSLTGSFYVDRAVVPSMKANGYGRIVHVSSRARLGDDNKANYSSAKAGLVGLTGALAVELGKDGITVNAIAPGYIETERTLGLRYHDDLHRRALEKTYTVRLGELDDTAAAVLYLTSAHAGFVTGEVLTVAGGRGR